MGRCTRIAPSAMAEFLSEVERWESLWEAVSEEEIGRERGEGTGISFEVVGLSSTILMRSKVQISRFGSLCRSASSFKSHAGGSRVDSSERSYIVIYNGVCISVPAFYPIST